MKKLFTLILFATLAMAAFAYSASIVNSRHDLTKVRATHDSFGYGNLHLNDYGEVCVYCHTPHGGSTDAPLWNRNTPAGSYQVYNSSATMDTTVPGMPNAISLACLSCHDGTIAVDSIINAPGSGANLTGPWPNGMSETLFNSHAKMEATSGQWGQSCGVCHDADGGPGDGEHDGTATYLTQDLSDDHPISMSYPTPAQDPYFKTTSDVASAGLRLFSSDTVECPTCHDVHDPAITPFLRISNSGSALCTACHIK